LSFSLSLSLLAVIRYYSGRNEVGRFCWPMVNAMFSPQRLLIEKRVVWDREREREKCNVVSSQLPGRSWGGGKKNSNWNDVDSISKFITRWIWYGVSVRVYDTDKIFPSSYVPFFGGFFLTL
jgi:hypothetical protein